MKIGIKGLVINCIIGINPDERINSQEILIDIEVEQIGDIKKDDINSTLNYEKLVDICDNISKEKKCMLIETLAKEILDSCFASLPISFAKICINKPRAIKNAASAYVKLSMERR